MEMKPENMLLEQIKRISDSCAEKNQNQFVRDEIRWLNNWEWDNRRSEKNDDDWWETPIIGGNPDTELDTSTDYSVLAEVQAIEPYLAGYTSQLLKKRMITDVEQAVIGIRNYRLFQIKHFVSWYVAHADEYPHLKEYMMKLDYWRLLLLQYIDLYLLET